MLVMLNHGGFMGIDPLTREQCTGFAKLGMVAGVSSYRSEDGSDGNISHGACIAGMLALREPRLR
ncbi:MAG TPA: hypothetical protein VGH87_22515, partial [Polyangiaceae bacterium]